MSAAFAAMKERIAALAAAHFALVESRKIAHKVAAAERDAKLGLVRFSSPMKAGR